MLIWKLNNLHVIQVGKATFLRWERLAFLFGKESALALIEGTSSTLLVNEFDERKQASMLCLLCVVPSNSSEDPKG